MGKFLLQESLLLLYEDIYQMFSLSFSSFDQEDNEAPSEDEDDVNGNEDSFNDDDNDDDGIYFALFLNFFKINFCGKFEKTQALKLKRFQIKMSLV
jgi:hypothetical protein